MESNWSESDRFSRRKLLAGTATTIAITTAGCLGTILGTGETSREITPTEPSTPRDGTPGEFYTLVERNDIVVDSLVLTGSELALTYVSDADDQIDSMEEISIIATVYNENLVKNDAGIDVLYAEVSNPFDGQAHGWGIQTDWLEDFNAGTMAENELWTRVLNSQVFAEDLEEESAEGEPSE